jgi:hypothetical protein|tara:strand:- start:129 stop:497 length:369 start_codon:yes stop_codon:yes gene_type:complete
MDYSNIISILCPNSIFTITNNEYATLVWVSTNTHTKPSENEIITKEVSLTYDFAYSELRYKRNKLLYDSDRYSLPDYPHLNDTIKNQWLTYRTSLRNITSQTPTVNIYTGEITNIIWPTLPS